MTAIPTTLSAADVVRLLNLAPHPEGGFYRETFRDDARPQNGRSASTAIYYLLTKGQASAWHRIDAGEVWHFYAGAPLELSISRDGRNMRRNRLGLDLTNGERPQLVVMAGEWQSAASSGDWTLAGCTVAPGFEFEAFELAPARFGAGL